MTRPIRPSLAAIVAEIVNDGDGEVTVDDIMPSLPEHTREKLVEALQWAKTRGYISMIRSGGAGNRYRLGTPTIYGPSDEWESSEPPPVTYGPPVSSVWELGDRALQEMTGTV